jgi:hypothetical protein
MANNLESLVLEEVSLVDNPSCAEIDPRTGRKVPRATVALTKRDSQYLNREDMLAYMNRVEKQRRKEKDDPGTQDVDVDEPTSNENLSASVPGWLPKKSKSKKKGMKKMKQKEIFQQVLKSATTSNRRDKIVTAVQLEARRIARKTGVSVQKAEADVWGSNPAAVKAYDAAPVSQLKPEQKLLKLTPSECELHRRARKLIKSTVGLSYAQACSKALEDSPELYRQYTVEVASGKYLDVPDTFQTGNDVVKSDDSDDDDECPDCGEDIDEDDQFCSSCGKKL